MLWQRGKSYSQDLRSRVLVAADEGARVGQIALTLRVSVSYVSKVLGRRLTGEVSARPQRCRRDRREIGGQAAIAIGGHGSLAGWNFCPKPEPSVPL